MTDAGTKSETSADYYTAFSCDVIAAMLEDKNNTFSLPWENRFIVSALQHGRRENPLYKGLLLSEFFRCLPFRKFLTHHVLFHLMGFIVNELC